MGPESFNVTEVFTCKVVGWLTVEASMDFTPQLGNDSWPSC